MSSITWVLWLAWAEWAVLSTVQACPQTACDCFETLTVACIDSDQRAIPQGIPANTHELYVKFQNIGQLSRGDFSNLPDLRTLMVTESRVQVLEPNVFGGLSQLSYLDLSSNDIQRIQPYTFNGLPGLRRLMLDSNSFSRIDNYAFYGLNLTRLRLENVTGLTGLASKTFDSATIRELFISNASLGTESLGALMPLKVSLRELSIAHNTRPLIVPENLFEGFEFRTLKLTYSGISEPSFLRYVVTDELSLTGNPLGPWDLSLYPSLNQVRTLRLDDTRFHALHGSYFSGMRHLRELHLAQNGITTLPSDLQPVFSRLHRLDLEHNSLFCNCELIWFKQWMMSASSILEGGKCSMPYQESLAFVEQDDMTCRPPTILSVSQDLKVAVNGEVTLICVGEGNPPPTIIWRYPEGSVTIKPSSDRNNSRNTGVLRLGSAQKADEGVYQCVASNVRGNISRSVDVTVYGVAGQSQAPAGRGSCAGDCSKASSLVFYTPFLSFPVLTLLYGLVRDRHLTKL